MTETEFSTKALLAERVEVDFSASGLLELVVVVSDWTAVVRKTSIKGITVNQLHWSFSSAAARIAFPLALALTRKDSSSSVILEWNWMGIVSKDSNTILAMATDRTYLEWEKQHCAIHNIMV